MSIPNIYNKIKSKISIDTTTFVYLCIIIGVGIGAFTLGRLSINQGYSTDDEVLIEDYALKGEISNLSNLNKPNEISSTIKGQKEETSQEEKRYVASKNGKLYYSIGCKAAQRIKPENEVWFKSVSDAERSGYAPSTSCK